MVELKLDLLLPDTHSLSSIAIVDNSVYPLGFTIASPVISITPPGFDIKTNVFVPNSANVFNTQSLGIVCSYCDNINLPDGIWKFKYTLAPAYKYYVEKSIGRTNLLQMKFDKAFLSLQLVECIKPTCPEDRQALDQIEIYINTAVAAGNNCLDSLFNAYYSKANSLLDVLINKYV
jgi:hypothetical protein